MLDDLTEKMPKFYGAVTVGERGQIAIPAEARRDQKINPGSKLLVFGGPERRALMFVKSEFVTEFITSISTILAEFERVLRTDAVEASK